MAIRKVFDLDDEPLEGPLEEEFQLADARMKAAGVKIHEALSAVMLELAADPKVQATSNPTATVIFIMTTAMALNIAALMATAKLSEEHRKGLIENLAEIIQDSAEIGAEALQGVAEGKSLDEIKAMLQGWKGRGMH